jgi:hypothetical protein
MNKYSILLSTKCTIKAVSEESAKSKYLHSITLNDLYMGMSTHLVKEDENKNQDTLSYHQIEKEDNIKRHEDLSNINERPF